MSFISRAKSNFGNVFNQAASQNLHFAYKLTMSVIFALSLKQKQAIIAHEKQR